MVKPHLVLLAALMAPSSALFAQAEVRGSYTDGFGTSLILNANHRFLFHWGYDLMCDLATGEWSVEGDTL